MNAGFALMHAAQVLAIDERTFDWSGDGTFAMAAAIMQVVHVRPFKVVFRLLVAVALLSCLQWVVRDAAQVVQGSVFGAIAWWSVWWFEVCADQARRTARNEPWLVPDESGNHTTFNPIYILEYRWELTKWRKNHEHNVEPSRD